MKDESGSLALSPPFLGVLVVKNGPFSGPTDRSWSDVEALLRGPVFEPIRRDRELFRKLHVERGTLCWPGDVDLCPDTVLWDGPPPNGGPDSQDHPHNRIASR
jgi:hypothetical protein